MKKITLIIFFYLIFCNTGFAESFYFKKCNFSEKYFANYLIDLNKNLIEVTYIQKVDGSVKERIDAIELVTKDKIVAKKIRSKSNKELYFQYFLEANSKSVNVQNYKKKTENGIYRLDGPKKQNFCKNVKADWDESNKKLNAQKKQEKLKEKEKKKIIEKKKRERELALKAKKEKEKEKNKHNISISAKKWIKVGANTSTIKKQLRNDFKIRASELCSFTGNFDILSQQIKLLEIDENPAFGLEAKINLGIEGVIKCK